jgi:hypothetical protein
MVGDTPKIIGSRAGMGPALIMKVLTPSDHREDHARVAIIADPPPG